MNPTEKVHCLTSSVTAQHAPPAKPLFYRSQSTKHGYMRGPKEFSSFTSTKITNSDFTKFNPLQCCVLFPKSHLSLLIHKDSVA
ncbi:hypothetical protein THF1D04_100041 [Vibrio owensii]|uniref:Uncharacterized protein n=1 Tax=Vibrio owensii TaxID=696485 RepID=A0AAU9Q2D3_9VIBR|nr:hypothetical protein THF1D04_100041 [Vibrio owensii]